MKTTFLLFIGCISLTSASCENLCYQRHYCSVKEYLVFFSNLKAAQPSMPKEQIWSRNSYLTFKPHYCIGAAVTSAAFSYTAVFFDETWPTIVVSNDAKCQRNFREVLSTLNNILKTFSNPVCKPRPVKIAWGLGTNIFRRANKWKPWTVSEKKNISAQSCGTW